MTAVSGAITLANPLPESSRTRRTRSPLAARRRYTHGLRRERLSGFPGLKEARRSMTSRPNATSSPSPMADLRATTAAPAIRFCGGIYAYTKSPTLNSMSDQQPLGYDGGAVLAIGPLTVTNTTFSNNSVTRARTPPLFTPSRPGHCQHSTFYTTRLSRQRHLHQPIRRMTVTVSRLTLQ